MISKIYLYFEDASLKEEISNKIGIQASLRLEIQWRQKDQQL